MRNIDPINSSLSPVAASVLRRVAGTFATGVTAITTIVGDRPYGCAASAVSSVSLDPPLMLLCLAHTSNTHAHLLKSRVFAINILGDSAQSRQLCRTLARQSVDRFIDVEFRRGVTGAPLLKQAISWMECELIQAFDSGDHTIFIGRVVAAEDTEEDPLIYFRGKFGSLTLDASLPWCGIKQI
jgi:flavin reductase (DIM6/NTAB) family NADH-FMN oxidoreductase RutF